MSFEEDKLFEDTIIKEEYSLNQQPEEFYQEVKIESPSRNSIKSVQFVIKAVKEDQTRSKKFHCNVCLKYFPNKKGLTRHQFSHITEPKPCTICKKILKNSRSLQRHMLIHDKTRSKYKCLRCPSSFSTRYTVNRHISAVHDRPKDEIRKKFTCKECGKQYNGKSDFQRHVLIHLEETDIKCPECPKKFKQQKHLDVHMDFHRKVKPFMCEICGIPFKTPGLLTKHVARHLDKSIVCPHCKNIYKNRLSFKDHMRDLHKGLPIDISVRPLYCTICKDRFDDLDSLRDHVKIHNYSGAFECGYCGKLFRRKNNLKTHLLKVHTKVPKTKKAVRNELSVPLSPVSASASNEFKFACPHCDKKCFTRPYYLFHLSLHSNVQSFECEFCKIKFKSEKYLKLHKCENSCKRDKMVKPEQQNAEFPVNPATIKTEIEDSECLESQIEISEYIKIEEDVSIVKTEEILD